MAITCFGGKEREIRLGTNDRRRHTYIIGQTGIDKSKLSKKALRKQDLTVKGFAFIDPMATQQKHFMGCSKERVEDVIYFNPGDISNQLALTSSEFDSPDQRDFSCSGSNRDAVSAVRPRAHRNYRPSL